MLHFCKCNFATQFTQTSRPDGHMWRGETLRDAIKKCRMNLSHLESPNFALANRGTFILHMNFTKYDITES